MIRVQRTIQIDDQPAVEMEVEVHDTDWGDPNDEYRMSVRALHATSARVMAGADFASCANAIRIDGKKIVPDLRDGYFAVVGGCLRLPRPTGDLRPGEYERGRRDHYLQWCISQKRCTVNGEPRTGGPCCQDEPSKEGK